MYVLGDRGTLEISASREAAVSIFEQNQVMWRIAERIDGKPLLNAAITIPDGAGSPNTVGFAVVLN
jgi:HK97 family phage major capsid protein